MSEAELLELAWGVIANAGGGDWTLETEEWQGAAARWRTRYHAYLDRRHQLLDKLEALAKELGASGGTPANG